MRQRNLSLPRSPSSHRRRSTCASDRTPLRRRRYQALPTSPSSRCRRSTCGSDPRRLWGCPRPARGHRDPKGHPRLLRSRLDRSTLAMRYPSRQRRQSIWSSGRRWRASSTGRRHGLPPLRLPAKSTCGRSLRWLLSSGETRPAPLQSHSSQRSICARRLRCLVRSSRTRPMPLRVLRR